MQDSLQIATIAIPTAFAALMVLDLISNLKQLWKSCEPSTRISIPVSIPQPLPEVAAPAEEPEQSEITPDPWTLEPPEYPISTTPNLTLVPINLLLLPPAKSKIEVIEVAETVVSATQCKSGRPRSYAPLDAEFSPNPVAKRKPGRPRKAS